ncbi:MAG: chitobiase/beta-hexosaminidase C-terminal domain-containing protein, partial [Muribaculaceae bacterium]|nr:chitobiase/beta-hexosaminidase C-terminal domain-containing protein [Muribaculaceae bacterium]
MKKFLLSLATVLCAGAFASADEVTVAIAATNFTPNANNAKIATYSAEGFTFTLNQASSSTANRLSDTNHLRIYKGAEFTISGDNGQTITGMTFTADGSGYNKFNDVSWSGNTGTWTGTAANSVTLTNEGQTRIKQVVITYTAAGGVVVPVPTFSIEPGTFAEAQTVELAAEDGCTIYYTLDGQDPTDDT